MNVLSLDGVWRARGFDYQHGDPETYVGECVDERTFIPASVPGEIHLDLMRVGRIEDCNVNRNAEAARWVEEQKWVYRTVFSAPDSALREHAELVFDGLDLCAVIYLNGIEIGRHANAFTPCRLDVTGKIRPGQNTLAVLIESGLYSVSENPGAPYKHSEDQLLHKRSWLRKPQYSFSWDWNPRLINVGIWKSVRLEWGNSPRIDAVNIQQELSADHTLADLHVRTFLENTSDRPVECTLRATILEGDIRVVHQAELLPGSTMRQLDLQIPNPKLWWPRPHGDQPLYTVLVEVLVDGEVVDFAKRRTGIRSIEIDRSPHPVEGEYFILKVNGRPIFCKGGNWVPPDMIYARTDDARLRKLVDMAVKANFNTLRIWGGGLYAPHALLDACDEAGILIWHDFLFACSKYPADDPEFLQNVRDEVRFAVRDLSHHASLLVWCGNNEIEIGNWDWGYDQGKAFPDYALYHMEIPRIIEEEDPSRPYWPSSPYSTENRHPNDPTTGDQHPWHVTLREAGTNFWAYREDVSRFPNEGGVLGASTPATIAQFLPEGETYLFSPTWEFHDNACNYWTSPGVAYNTIKDWIGIDPDELTFDDYIFYSALMQAEGLKEYIENYRRRMFSSSAAIFWMYNDSWPVSHGWTIVDYYLRRKLAYHPVRRAFEPVHVVAAVEGEKVIIVGVNDTQSMWYGELRYGLFAISGGMPMSREVTVCLAANDATVLAEFPIAEWNSAGRRECGAFALLYHDGDVIAQNRTFIERFKDLKWAKPRISITRTETGIRFSSPTFVWGVSIDLNGEAKIADNAFDLLPGVPYTVPWPSDAPLPKVLRIGSLSALGACELQKA